MSFIIFDTEYTSWSGCNEHGWHGKQKKEIVQIAAIKVSNDLRVLDSFNVLCKPVINPNLSAYFEKLTGITNKQISQKGISFYNAYKKFKKFVGKSTCVSHGFGGSWENKADGDIILENLRLYQINDDSHIKYHNIASWLLSNYKKSHLVEYPRNSGAIAKMLNKEDILAKLGIDEHNALYDSYSILYGIKYFRKNIDSLLTKMGMNL